jgi:hypothetical protein
MIFNSKQLEELENIHDSTGAFEEEGDDDAGFDEVGEAAMDWRRGLIEEAAENIKRAKTRPVEPHIQYNIGSMLFDREEKRFARVQRSVPGYLKIVYLSGGDREYGTLDVIAYLKDQGAQKRLSELSEQLGLPDGEVALELDRLGITPLEEIETPAEAAAAEAAAAAAAAAGTPADAAVPPFVRAGKGKAAAEPVEEEEEEEAVAPSGDDEENLAARPVGGKAPQKPAPGKPGAGRPQAGTSPPKGAKTQPPTAARTQPPVAAKGAAPAAAKGAQGGAGKKPLNGTSAPAAAKGAGGKGVNPIDDPNGYIKAHFNEMSNRELARLTGLSEHTIRRKLGEWGLKRKREL